MKSRVNTRFGTQNNESSVNGKTQLIYYIIFLQK